MKKISILMVLGLLLGSNSIQAKSLKDQVPVTKTKLEKFSARTGTVIIQGFEEIGSVYGLDNTNITIKSKEFINVSTGKKEYGITIEVKSESRGDTSFIDYDEIDSLIKGIDYISKVDTSATKFTNFQADYKTKGNFKISTFNKESKITTFSKEYKILVAVSSGYIGEVTAYYAFSDLSRIKGLIVKAKNQIDSAKK